MGRKRGKGNKSVASGGRSQHHVHKFERYSRDFTEGKIMFLNCFDNFKL